MALHRLRTLRLLAPRPSVYPPRQCDQPRGHAGPAVRLATGDHMTKADRIRELLTLGVSRAGVAGMVGCLPEYVRAVIHRDRNSQRHGTGRSLAEQASANERRRTRYATDADWRARHRMAVAANYRKRKARQAGELAGDASTD